MEEQIFSLKSDLTEVRKVHIKRHRSPGPDVPDLLEHNSHQSTSDCQKPSDLDGDCSEKLLAPHVTFSYVYQRNKSHDWVPLVAVDNADDLEQEIAANEAEIVRPARSQGLTGATGKQYHESHNGENEGHKLSVFVSPEHPCCKTATASVNGGKRSSSVFIRSGKAGVSITSCKPACFEAELLNHSCASSSSAESTFSRASSDDFGSVENGLHGSRLASVRGALRNSVDEKHSLDDSFNHLVETNSDTSLPAIDLKIRARVKTRKPGARGQTTASRKKVQLVDAAVGSAAATVQEAFHVDSSETNAINGLNKLKFRDASVGSAACKQRDVSVGSAVAELHDVSVGCNGVEFHDVSLGTDVVIPCDAFTEMNDTLTKNPDEGYLSLIFIC
jgi:hypothetical protein